MKKKNTTKYYKLFTINVIMTVIDEFQLLNLFVFELLFVGPKWFMGQTHLPGENPKAQTEEGYGPSSTR